MKNNIGQLEDTVILSLVDAHASGMDFSDACVFSKVPHDLESEAKDYWDTLSAQIVLSHSLFPKKNIIDEVFARAEVFRTGELLRPATPSPYMKYVMAFAAPLALAVLVIGVAFRSDSQSAPFVAMQDLSSAGISHNEIVTASPSSATQVAPLSAKTPSPAARTMVAAKSAPTAVAFSVPVSSPSDPKQLFAMLQDAGVQEAQSDVLVDDVYDAKLSELDAKVIDQNANLATYVSLQ